MIPAYIVGRICESLCMSDIVASKLARKFTLPRHRGRICPRSPIDRQASAVELDGRRCSLRVYPGSINVEEVQRIANAPRTLEYEAQLRADSADSTIVRIDRAEPNKNIVRGFRAYDQMCRPPRTEGTRQVPCLPRALAHHVRHYQRYLDEVKKAIKQVNDNQRVANWEPIVPSSKTTTPWPSPV